MQHPSICHQQHQEHPSPTNHDDFLEQQQQQIQATCWWRTQMARTHPTEPTRTFCREHIMGCIHHKPTETEAGGSDVRSLPMLRILPDVPGRLDWPGDVVPCDGPHQLRTLDSCSSARHDHTAHSSSRNSQGIWRRQFHDTEDESTVLRHLCVVYKYHYMCHTSQTNNTKK